jgi:hypothetical protein
MAETVLRDGSHEAFVQFGIIHGKVLAPSPVSTAIGMPDDPATVASYAC